MTHRVVSSLARHIILANLGETKIPILPDDWIATGRCSRVSLTQQLSLQTQVDGSGDDAGEFVAVDTLLFCTTHFFIILTLSIHPPAI